MNNKQIKNRERNIINKNRRHFDFRFLDFFFYLNLFNFLKPLIIEIFYFFICYLKKSFFLFHYFKLQSKYLYINEIYNYKKKF